MKKRKSKKRKQRAAKEEAETFDTATPLKKEKKRRLCECGHERDAHTKAGAIGFGCIMCNCRLTKEVI